MFRPKRRSDDFRFPHFLGATYLPTSLHRASLLSLLSLCGTSRRKRDRQTCTLRLIYLPHSAGWAGDGASGHDDAVVRARSDNVFLFLCVRVSKRIVTILEGGEFV